jgi:hypothetical protein
MSLICGNAFIMPCVFTPCSGVITRHTVISVLVLGKLKQIFIFLYFDIFTYGEYDIGNKNNTELFDVNVILFLWLIFFLVIEEIND